jgi:hypothetical protein
MPLQVASLSVEMVEVATVDLFVDARTDDAERASHRARADGREGFHYAHPHAHRASRRDGD